MEANERHGLSLPLRSAVYEWFERWLAGRADAERIVEFPITPRPPSELLVCADGQVNRTFRSRPLLPLALERIRFQEVDSTHRSERLTPSRSR